MMLKRLSHFADNQNWSAIALELVIVTIGVFIGVQLGNWNERLQTRDAFRQAESRLLAEHDANISAVDAFLTQANASLAVSQSSIKTLRTCSDGPDALAVGENVAFLDQVAPHRSEVMLTLSELRASHANFDSQERPVVDGEGRRVRGESILIFRPMRRC